MIENTLKYYQKFQYFQQEKNFLYYPVLSLILKFKWFSKGKRNKILESTTLFQISRISRTNEISDKFMNTANNYRKTFEKGL